MSGPNCFLNKYSGNDNIELPTGDIPFYRQRQVLSRRILSRQCLCPLADIALA